MTARYWIALNGSGCALSVTPWREPVTNPVAEQMFGFPTLDEAKRAQMICLKSTLPEVEAWMENLQPAVRSGRVAYRRPANPGPQTRGETAWMEVGTHAVLAGLPGGSRIS
jgi:hypothetical protein